MALQIIVKNSSVSGNEPTAGQLANGELALNYHANGPFITCKDTAGVVRRVAGVWVNATAPSSPMPGEFWLDISVNPPQLKVYKDSGDTWVAAITVYAATTSIAGVIELATDAETQTGSETNRAVTPASLQSKLSDSTSTTSSTTIASSTAVKAAYDLANAALPKAGGTVTGNLEIGTAGSLSFEGATADGFETTIAITDPTADRTITLPNTTGTVVTTGDTGTVTSTMILDGTIVDADINASAEIAVSKLADGTARQLLQTDAAGTGVEWASNIDIPGTLDVTSAATFDSTVTIAGDLTVNGTTTNINTVNLTVEDKNIIIADVATPSDVTADGGGITLKGATDKTINWIDATDAWTLSEHVNIASAKEYRIAGTKVLDATSLGSAVVGSSLTSVGTIGTGVWQGTAIVDTYLGTISTALKVSNSATTAASANTASAIVARNASGNFTAGTITASLTGNASTVTTNANLTGHITSVGNAAVLGSFTSAQLATALTDETGSGAAVFATSPTFVTPALGTPSSGTLTNCTFPTLNQSTTGNAATVTTNANLTGDVTSVGNATTIAAGVIVDADVNASAAIVDTKLATISTAGKVSNSATTATNANTASAIVARNASGNFTAGTITAALTGAASSNVLKAGDTMTGALVMPLGVFGTPSLTFTDDFNTGIFSPGADQLAVATNGVERVRLSSTGEFMFKGAGTTPGTDKAVYFSGSAPANSVVLDSSGRLLVGTSSYTGNSKFAIAGGSGTDVALLDLRFGGARPTGADSGICEIRFGSTDQTSNNAYAKIECITDGASSSDTDIPARLVFSTTADGAATPAERMRITQNGLFQFGTTNLPIGIHEFNWQGANRMAFNNKDSVDANCYGLVINYYNAAPNNTGNEFIYCQDNVSQRFSARSNGGLANYSANNANLSDRNVKKDISPATGTWDCLKEWEIVNYRYKDQPDDADLNLGVIAQQVAESCPEVITIFQEAKEATEDAPAREERLGVKEQQMYWMAIKALQEAQVRIEQLESKVAALELNPSISTGLRLD